jgi:hypothetical protein
MLCSHTTRSRHRHARRGFSLVELLVATILLIIIFIGWLQIANFQAIRKESLRRLALEKAAGYLDVMSELRPGAGQYRIDFRDNTYNMAEVEPFALPLPLFTNASESSSSPGYVLRVVRNQDISDETEIAHLGWTNNIERVFGGELQTYWAIIELYNETHQLDRPFSRMSVFYAGSN